jgi:hypothetical protein
LNHSCDPNVQIWDVEGTDGIIVLVSERPIKTGEEICMTYQTSWADLSEDTLKFHSTQHAIAGHRLKMRWGIFCPPECICHDNFSVTLAMELSRLSKVSATAGSKGDFKASLVAAKEKLQLFNTQPRLSGNFALKLNTLAEVSRVAAKLKSKAKKTKEMMTVLKEIQEMIDKVEFPGSVVSLEYQRLLNEQPWL